MKNKLRSVFLFTVVLSVIFLLLGCPQIKNKCPSLTKVSGPSGNEYHNSCDFSWKGTDSDGHIVRYEIRRDDGIWENVSLATNYTWASFSEGSHLLEVRAKDDYGDYSNTLNWTFSYLREESTGGQTDNDGSLIFESKSLNMDVMVNVNESETGIPVCEMDIFLVNDGSTLIMTAVDKKGRYLPSIATLSLGEQQNQKASSYYEQSLSLLGTLVVAGTITLAPLVAQAWGTFIAYGIAENLNAIFRDPPTINNVGLYLHSSGLGVKFSITATPENAWDTLRIGLDLKSFGTLFSGPLSAVFVTVAEDYMDSLALDFAHHLVECWGLDWYKQYDIEFVFYQYSTRLGLDVIEVVSVKPTENEPPTVTKISGPNGEVSESSSTFTWTGSDSDGTIAKYEYRKDEGSWVSNGTSTSYTWNGYSEGPHKFEVRAQDNKGEYSEAVEWNFTYSTGTVIVGEMVLVEGGTFMMGDEFGDLWANSRPVHEVTLTYDFWLSKYEVIFDEYDAFCDATGRSKPDDWSWGRGTRPVMNVSWWDAIAYCNWLSVENGLPVAYRIKGEVNEGELLDSSGNVTTDITEVVGYRLPTEAEWEYAARGGKHNSPYKYSGSDTVGDVAWYDSNSGSKTQEVGKKLPNALDIYDMSGNVWEWCSDWTGGYSSSAQTNPYNNSNAGFGRVNRGGGWVNDAAYARVAIRVSDSPTGTYYGLGFRICRTVP